ncbi:hypothetical protein D6D54_06400, partial [Spiroplasma poulsonii]
HDYEIPTFNYPQYVLPPVPYNYKTYTKDIWDANTAQPLKTKIIAPSQCKVGNSEPVNLFSVEFNDAYYETEIDLKQIDPTIQSISKFQDAYKKIEISNLSNLQVRCFKPDIERFIKDRDINLLGGDNSCDYNFGSLSNITLQKSGLEQKDNVNFDNTITLYTDNIKVNDTETKYATAYTNGLPSGNYPNTYFTYQNRVIIKFLLQITKLSNNDNHKIKETYLQAYYTNDVKLKIRFSKVLFVELLGQITTHWKYWGNNKNITIDLNALGVLNMINNGDNPIQITIKPR